MGNANSYISIQTFLLGIIYLIPSAFCNDGIPIPADMAQVEPWFTQYVTPLAQRTTTLDPALVAAEANVRIIRLRSDGGGNFRTINDAINSIPANNIHRVIIFLGPGTYTEKIKIDRTKPFITFHGDPINWPLVVFNGTAKQYNTVECATVIIESDYFSAVNVKFVNTAPRPDGKMVGAQAVALRISGDKASFYYCAFHGFQDTLLDDRGRHFFKNCYIEGTVDFIFGDGKSIYLNTEIHVVPGDSMTFITAQARETTLSDVGYSFVHCSVTGGSIDAAFLGRAWKSHPKVIFSYSELGIGINKQGWSDNGNSAYDHTVFFGEFDCTGPGSSREGRAKFTRMLTFDQAKRFISLSYIMGSMWLLPPTAI